MAQMPFQQDFTDDNTNEKQGFYSIDMMAMQAEIQNFKTAHDDDTITKASDNSWVQNFPSDLEYWK